MITTLSSFLLHILISLAYAQLKESSLYVDPQTNCSSPTPNNPECPFKTVYSALEAIKFFGEKTKDEKPSRVKLFLKEGNDFYIPNLEKDMINIALFEICAYRESERTCEDFQKSEPGLPSIILFENSSLALVNVVFRLLNLKFNLIEYRASVGRNLFYFENGTITICSSLFENGKVTGLWENSISLFVSIDCSVNITNNYFTNNSFSNVKIFSFSSTMKPNTLLFRKKYRLNLLETKNFSYFIHISGNSLSENVLKMFTLIKVQGFDGGVFLGNNRVSNNTGNAFRFPLIDILDIIELQFKNNILGTLINDQNIISLMQIRLVLSAWLINTTIGGDNSGVKQIWLITEFVFYKIFNLKLENTSFFNKGAYLSMKNINEIIIINTLIKTEDNRTYFSNLPLLQVTDYNNIRIDKLFAINFKTLQSLFDITVSNNKASLYPTSGSSDLNGLYLLNTTREISIKVLKEHSITIRNSTFRGLLFERHVLDLLILNSNLSLQNCYFEKTDFAKSQSASIKAPVSLKGAYTDICLTNLKIENIYIDQAGLDLPDYFLLFDYSCQATNILIRDVEMSNSLYGLGGGGLIFYECEENCPETIRLVDCKLIHKISGDYYSGLNFISIERTQIFKETEGILEIERFRFETILKENLKELNTQNVNILFLLIYHEVNIINICMNKTEIVASEALFYLKGYFVTIQNIIMKMVRFLVHGISHQLFQFDCTEAKFINISNCEFSFERFNISAYDYYSELSILKIFFDTRVFFPRTQIEMTNIYYSGTPSNINTVKNHFLWIDTEYHDFVPYYNGTVIKNCKFLELMCVDGCIFYLPDGGNFSIFNSSFINILASGKGAVAFNNRSEFAFENSFFRSNIATQGDFIYFYNEQTVLELKNNTFIIDSSSSSLNHSSGLLYYRNPGMNFQEIYATDCNYQFLKNEFYLNVTVQCMIIKSNFHYKISKEEDSKLDFFQHKTNNNLTSVMIPMDNDKNGSACTQFYFELSREFPSLNIDMNVFDDRKSDTSNTFILETDLNSREKFNYIMFGYANEYNNSVWDYSGYINKNYKNTGIHGNKFVFVTINLNLCKAGEYYRGLVCLKCSSNSFSMPGWFECLQCPSTANCADGVLSTISGFWRSGPDSTIIYFCYSNPAACLGDSGRRFTTSCLWGYTGALCKACDKSIGFVINGNNECGKCGDNLIQLGFLFSLMFLIFLLFEFYLTFAEATEINKLSLDLFELDYANKKEPSVYLNTLLTHFQLLNLIQFISFNFPQELKQIAGFFADSSSQIIYSQYCFLYQIYPEENLVFTNFGLLMGCALIRLLLLIIFWLLFIVFKLKRAKKSQVLLVFATWGKIEFVTIFREWLLLGCEDVAGASHIKKDSNYICTTSYKKQFAELILPIVTAIVLMIPIVLLLVLIKYRKVLGSKKYVELFGSLYLGTKLKAFYWNTVIFFFKLAVIFFGIFGQGDSGQAYELFFLFLLYGFISYLLKPYRRAALNSLNEWSACIYLLTISFMLIKNVDSINKVMRYVTNSIISPEVIDDLLMILIYIINFSFLLFLVISIMIQYSEKLRVKFKRFKLRYYTFRHRQAEKKRHKNRRSDSINHRSIQEPLLNSSDHAQPNQKLFFSVDDNEFKKDYIKKVAQSLDSGPPKKSNEKIIGSLDKYRSQIESINVSEIYLDD